MELNRKRVPLHGQVEVGVVLQGVQSPHDNTEYYVLLEGCCIHHVTTAQRKGESNLLTFTVPGHNVAEKVSVQLFCREEEQLTLLSSSEDLSLEYIMDIIQEVTNILISDPLAPTSTTYQDIRNKFCKDKSLQFGQNSLEPAEHLWNAGLDEGSLRFDQRTHDCKKDTENHSAATIFERSKIDADHTCTLELCSDVDVKITQSLANIYSYLEWNNQRPQKSQDIYAVETRFNTAARLGLYHLTLFYLQQSGGHNMATLPHEEGQTPAELAQVRGHSGIINALTHTSACKEWRPVWLSDVWADGSHLLRFCPLTSSLVLTVKHNTHIDAERSIQLYREKSQCSETSKQVAELSESKEKRRQSQLHDISDENQTSVEDCAVVDNVLEKTLPISLDEDKDDLFTKKSGSPLGFCSPFQLHTTHTAADRLTAMLNRTGKSDELNRKYNIDGVTPVSSGTETSLAVKEEEGPKEQRPVSYALSTSLSHCSSNSPAGLVLERFLRSTYHSVQENQTADSPQETYELSPSLVALEMDSEEEDENFFIKKLLPPISSEKKSNGDKQESTRDPLGTYLNSSSTSSNHASPKETAGQGVRHRSYSYSAPKISQLPHRFSRDAQRPHADLSNDGVLSCSSSASRSLLQTLSLSKSLSLLNSVKQRAHSLSEQPQENRETFLKRAQSADDDSSTKLDDSLHHLTLSEFLKELEEEEWDKYAVPSNIEQEKYKVSRTFSFIKSRMYSTRSKNKGKAKRKEGKEKQVNGHQFAVGPVLMTLFCEVCEKLLTGKEILHCNNCAISIHKVCKDSAAPCLKKVQNKCSVSMMKARAATLPQNFIIRESSSFSQRSASASLPVTTQQDRKETNPLPCPLSRSASVVPEWLAESPDGDSEPWSTHGQCDEPVLTVESSTSTDNSLTEDTMDTTLQNGFGVDMRDFEAESWSLIVAPQFSQMQGKHTVKRQDVIYELMHTEVHHLQTLTIMAEVFRKGIREEVGLDADAISRLFPCLDELLLLHRDFLSALRERRQSSILPDSDKNYLIDHVGDILLQQFSQENAENMKCVYGEFCSRHNEAVSFFKELQQQNKKFQLFIKQQSSNALVKRREIPECILLVTQRITKYPVLLERILQYTEECTQDHADISAALTLVRELISAVDERVSEREQSQWLNDVLGRLESKSSAKLKNGIIFRKQDMTNGRALLHHGPLLWKTATGRLKDVLVLLLTDLLVFLQEKDQKFIFAAVDQKCPVVSLQKLIVREVANEERGMFLISASSSGPEMYEVHVASKDDRNTWMRLIREAVVICHEKENNITNESEEERRVADAKTQKIYRLQESLCSHDQLICSSLEEKLQIYAELSALAGHRDFCPDLKLLVRHNAEELPNASILLSAALREAENLKAALSFDCSPSLSPLLVEQTAPDTATKAEESPSAPSPSPPPLLQTEEVTQPPNTEKSDESVDFKGDENSDLQPLNHSIATDNHNMHLKVCQSVQSLMQLLYSLQAVVTIQDSQYEVRRLLLLLSNSSHPRVSPSSLKEQERQREAELWRQEVALVAREHQLWARECQGRQQHYEKWESELEMREQQCLEDAQQLQHQHEELEEQLKEYQHCLERLKEGQKYVKKEKEKLEMQQKMIERWKHGHQHNLKMEDPQWLEGERKSFHPSHFGVLDEDGSIFVNEAVFLAQSVNNQHLHHHQDQYQRRTQLHTGHADSHSAQNSLNSLLALSNHAHPTLSKQDEQWTKDRDVDPPIHTQDAWATVGARLYPGDVPSVPQAFVSMETETQDAEGEEKIVFL